MVGDVVGDVEGEYFRMFMRCSGGGDAVEHPGSAGGGLINIRRRS